MIKDLSNNNSKMSLFIRYRRFVKAFNISMAQRFFENIDYNNYYHFNVLDILKAEED